MLAPLKPLFAVAVVLTVSLAWADTGDDTLRFYLSKSTLVVSGTLTRAPKGFVTEVGVTRWSFDIERVKVLKGTLAGDRLNVVMSSFWSEQTTLKKGDRVILFLAPVPDIRPTGRLEEADPWFAIQPYSEMMESSLKRVGGVK